MKRILTLIVTSILFKLGFAQTPIFTENFNSAPDWTLNAVGQTILPGSTPTSGGNPNSFAVNNVGTTIDGTQNLHITCSGFICNLLGAPGPVYNASGAANNTNTVAHMNYDVLPSAFSGGPYTFSFQWTCNGASNANNGSGRLVYSLNNGTSWVEYPTNLNGNGGVNTVNLDMSVFTGFVAGVTPIRFGFRWFNSGTSGHVDPPLIVDNLQITVPTSTNSISAGVTAGQPVCAGSSTTVPFTSFGTYNAGNIYTVQLSDANGNFGSPTDIGTLSSTANSGTINVTIPAGISTGNLYQIRITSSNPVAFSGNVNQVALSAAVTPTVSIASNATSICTGASVDFSATPTNGGSSPSYAWTINGNPAGTGSTLTTNSLTNGAVIQAILTSNAACAVPTNANSNSITMTVNSSLTPAVSISSDLGNTICSGSSVTFSATPTNGGATPTYAWTINGNPIGTNTSTLVQNTLIQGDVVALTITSSDACANPTTATSNSITFSVNPTVTPSISITANPGNVICSGTLVDFLQSPLNGGSSAVYEWFINGVSQGFAPNGFSSSTLVDGDVVSVSMTTNELCVTQNTVSSNSITMSITTSVVPSVSIESASGTNVCKGSTLSLNANATNGGSAPIYNWSINGTSIGTSPTITTPAISGPTIVEVTLTSNDNCANGATATQSISIDVYELPILNVSSTPSNCAGISTGSVSVSVTGGSPALSYSWNTVPVATTATVNNLAGGIYTVTITYGNGCTITADATVESSSITLSSSVIIGQTTEQNPSGSVSINVAGGTPPYSYVWNTTPPQFLNTATELTSGTYSVIVTDASGCSAIFEFNVPNSVGIKDISNEEIEVFPNPTKNILYLKSNSNANATTNISIVDVSGKMVLNENTNLQGKNLQTIDLTELPRGVYFLLLTRDNIRINKKVVKL